MQFKSSITSGLTALVLTTASTALAGPDSKAFVRTIVTKTATSETLMAKSFCNFSLVEIDGLTRYVTARHCVEDGVTAGSADDDIVILDALPAGSRTGNLTDMKIHNVSTYTSRTIDGQVLTLKGYLPNLVSKTMIPYSISGEVRYDPTTKKVLMTIGITDLVRMLKGADRSCWDNNAVLSGISGSGTFDRYGNYFGAISQGEAICAYDKDGKLSYNLKTSYGVWIQSLQDHLKKTK